MLTIYEHKTCRACKGDLQEILNLGTLHLNAFPQHVGEIGKIPQVPLILTVCQECGLVQLDRTVPPDWMYRTYWYRSGVNEMMVQELHRVAAELAFVAGVRPGDHVLDIGANDGTLLSAYETSVHRTGVEPALNLHARLQAHCDVLVGGYFPLALAGQFKAISAIAMCYDLEEPLRFFQGIHDHLLPGGAAVIQFQDFGQQLSCSAFDNICHEHLEYYTLWSLSHLFRQTGLTMQRVVTTPINGGSLRVFLRRVEDRIPAEQSVALQLIAEQQQHLDTPTIRDGNLSAFVQFANRVALAKRQILSTLQQALDAGCVVDQYGASTKGNITLQVLGIGPSTVRQAIDRSPEKEGLHTITGIPIVGETREDPADVWFVTAWQFRESILRREGWYLEQGGTLLFPLPQVEIVRTRWRA